VGVGGGGVVFLCCEKALRNLDKCWKKDLSNREAAARVYL